ncbi:MAG TPA: FKBP-type peptidyl-prolyl cis-trans isomerase [Chthoniobacterales bacterium]|nr:FKBP-type peptidyl-prolyl cis-trans isomerase [Chthoniobacterales bacterium]
MTTRPIVLAFVLIATLAFGQGTRIIPTPADVGEAPADAVITASGLASKLIAPGTGRTHPARNARVTVDYTGWTTDGKMFDSSLTTGKPATFPLDKVIAGWTEGVQLMVAGETRRFWIPESLAYKGKEGRPKGTLVFDVKLISFAEPPPSQTPTDFKTPPSAAKRTASGLSYQVLKPGSGKRHPTELSTVTVHYSGWTTDGKMFDSSLKRGQPTTFPLKNVIPGWTEGVQLMVEGEKTRFWIPESLAYKGQGPVFGDLVFDIELIKID